MPPAPPRPPARRVAVTGASGPVGGALCDSLERDGVEVLRLVRRPPRAGEAHWDPDSGAIDAAALEGVDGVVHLAGEKLDQRWTPEAKRRILSSRTRGTGLLARTLASLRRPPEVLVSVSAVGYYGDRGDEPLTEEAGPGEDFLAGVVRAWEEAADPAREAGIRVAHPRLGVVLSPRGGMLERVLPFFRLGLGGPLGGGRQYMSWIALADAVRALRFLLDPPGDAPGLAGPVNATSPEPATNEEFTRTLGRVLHRPALVPVPAAALRVAFGEMARGTVLVSQRALPRRLREAGFEFHLPHLEDALRATLAHDP
jgi:uncharacterized protein (TIGR01777 family)